MVSQRWIGCAIALLLAANPASAWARTQESHEPPPSGNDQEVGRSVGEPPERAGNGLGREISPITRSVVGAPAPQSPAQPSWRLLAPPTDRPPEAGHPYNKLHVTGAGVSDFYYLRQDIYLDLADTDALRVQAIGRGKTFGPNPVGSIVKVRAGDNYVLLPVCGGQISPTSRTSVNLAFGQLQGEVTLSCQH